MLEMDTSGHILRTSEIKNMMPSSDILISRRIYVLRCQFGLVNFSDNQTGFFQLMDVSSSLFSDRIVVLVLVNSIQDVSFLVTGTLVPFMTISFHVTFELFNGFFPPFIDGLFPIIFPRFLTCRNFFNNGHPEGQPAITPNRAVICVIYFSKTLQYMLHLLTV